MKKVHAERIKELLSRYRLDITSEATVQDQIEKVLQESKIEYYREFRLSSNDRIDFFIGGIGIEIKINGPVRAIFRQCAKYCACDEIESLVLVSARAMGFPDTIKGKPCYYHNLGQSWL